MPVRRRALRPVASVGRHPGSDERHPPWWADCRLGSGDGDDGAEGPVADRHRGRLANGVWQGQTSTSVLLEQDAVSDGKGLPRAEAKLGSELIGLPASFSCHLVECGDVGPRHRHDRRGGADMDAPPPVDELLTGGHDVIGDGDAVVGVIGGDAGPMSAFGAGEGGGVPTPDRPRSGGGWW